MALVVQKFGGSSVGSIDKIRQVARKVIETREQGHDLVVVVSAMEGETNRLVSLAKTLSEAPDGREYDLLLATGEQAATALLAIALLAQGCPARSYSGFHIPIHTDRHHKKARILNIEEQLIRNEIKAGRIPIIAGFQGISDEGNLTTLGRGGSDTTAAALAAMLKADECQIYTDVDGIYTADPRIVPQAKRLDTIHATGMTELARAGAKVLQHRAVELASQHHIPLRVLSISSQGAGTLVQSHKMSSGLEQARVTGVTASIQEATISIQGLVRHGEALSRLFGLLNDARIEIDMLTQQLVSEGNMDITFTLARADHRQTQQLLQLLVTDGHAKAVVSNPNLAKLSIVGLGLHSHPGIVYTLFSTLNKEGINVYLTLSSDLRVSLIVEESQVMRGVKLLHDAFDLDGE